MNSFSRQVYLLQFCLNTTIASLSMWQRYLIRSLPIPEFSLVPHHCTKVRTLLAFIDAPQTSCVWPMLIAFSTYPQWALSVRLSPHWSSHPSHYCQVLHIFFLSDSAQILPFRKVLFIPDPDYDLLGVATTYLVGFWNQMFKAFQLLSHVLAILHSESSWQPFHKY
jgi:hypothetical protein